MAKYLVHKEEFAFMKLMIEGEFVPSNSGLSFCAWFDNSTDSKRRCKASQPNFEASILATEPFSQTARWL